MNILLINHYAGGPKYGMEFRPYYMSREWVRQGHRVVVAGADFSHVRAKQPYAGVEIVDGVRYVWLKTPVYQGNGIGRAKNMLVFLWRLWQYRNVICENFKPDIVVASSTYPFDNYMAYYFAKKYQAKYVYEVHDLWPLSPIELGHMSKYHPFIMLVQMAENFAYAHVDKVVSLLPCAEQHMREHGLPKGKFLHIPNGICKEEWDNIQEKIPQEHRGLLEKLKKKGVFLLGFAGGHAISNALIYLLQAAEQIREEKVAVVLVGKGMEKENLMEYAKENNLSNVYFLPPVNKKAVPDLLTYMDALYIGLNKQLLFRFGVSPNKVFDYMMAGKPILHSIEAGNDLVSEAECGISVAAENPVAIAEGIKQLMNLDEETRQAMGKRGRKFVMENFDYRVLSERFVAEVMAESKA